ncbi:MAG TPA: hypothetical protein VFU31_03450 [Candidatus Binatia bacterium]|nr:hypothetical protein [Candidatus Binatia bacterium]
MNFAQRISLLWRRFSPLEERLFAAVRGILPTDALPAFDAQVAGINHVQRLPGWTEIDFYRRRLGRVDWSDIPMFPRTDEFPLAEVRFSAGQRRFKGTLNSIAGHIFDFAIIPSPRDIAFLDWEGTPTARLLSDPLSVDALRPLTPVPDVWHEFMARHKLGSATGWTLHTGETARCVTLEDGEFVILAERGGDEFILHRIEPAASDIFYLESHDGKPEPIVGDIRGVFPTKRNA